MPDSITNFITKFLAVAIYLGLGAFVSWIFYFLKISRSSFVQKIIMDIPYISGGLRFLYTLTLELYIVHELLNYPFSQLKILFPLNIIVYLSASFIGAAIVHKGGSIISSYFFDVPKNIISKKRTSLC